MNTSPIKNFYRIDAYLVLCHTLLLVIGYGLWKLYPHIKTKPDMSGLFFMIISILGGFAGLIMLAVTLPRLDRSVRNLSVNKFILALLYWISSAIIFVLFGISKFFFNNPLVLLVFVLVFFSSIYLSVIRLADMRKKDWLILSGIFGAIVLFFFLPKL
ncbi:hypothetical protein JZM32_05495 [Acinetobacter pittii]|uniref:hypothetical protein n=1 Tax=Acinetobacter pittii TaxID=48296 RepID=UPI00197EBA34|nr:hypothetical protein [Acinetobacter pittii]MBN6527444.1 hypothetical protein [Acinetobacter pittii]MBN6537553.1 hypothetical protein [Acinetobacter pittii]MEB6671022.1 hypothetical protein [Acinetobacter pittii]